MSTKTLIEANIEPLQRYIPEVEVIAVRKQIAEHVKALYGSRERYSSISLKPTGKKTIIYPFFDWHFGEIIRRKLKQNYQIIHSYNFEESHKRMDRYVSEGIKYMQSFPKGTFDEIVFALGGDLADGNGNIYTGQVRHLQAQFWTQFFEVFKSIRRQIYRLQDVFGTVVPINIYSVPGNHGESRGVISDPLEDNLDTSVARLLNDWIQDQKVKNVKIEYDETSPMIDFEVKGHKFAMVHEMPTNLLTPAAKNKIKTISIDRNPEVVLTGHIHEMTITKEGKTKVVRVGGAPGPNAYSETLYIPYGAAEQTIIVASKERALENIMPINLSKTAA